METAYKIGLVSGITCKDGRHFQEINCVAKDGKMLTILLPTTNTCENFPDESCDVCRECEDKDTCEIMAPCDIEVGRSLIIVDNNEYGAIKPINEIGKHEGK